MEVKPLALPGLLLFTPKLFGDARGHFFETWQIDRYAAAGLPRTFVQDNLAESRRGVLRGLHFQNPRPQGKLVHVLRGSVYDVVVDLRVGTPTFGKWVGVELSADNRHQLWVPPGFAHGYYATSETAIFAYKCTELYDPTAEASLLWNDPDLVIKWPLQGEPIVSPKDQAALRLKDLPKQKLFAP